jgi:hypothetical protein
MLLVRLESADARSGVGREHRPDIPDTLRPAMRQSAPAEPTLDVARRSLP